MAVTIDLSTKTIDELKTLIVNHEAISRTTAPRYLAAGKELAQRSVHNLSYNKTVAIITESAKAETFLGFKDVASRSGAVWAKVHHLMGAHLLDVSRHAHRLGLPLLSAIVVNKQPVADGAMEPDTLIAFCNCARALGITVGDELAFLQEQQAAVFTAAKEGRLG